MHARVVIGKVQPGRGDDFVEVFNKHLLPSASGDEGFQKIMLFTKEGDDVVAVALYDTEEHAQASEARFKERMGAAMEVLASPPNAAIYELRVEG